MSRRALMVLAVVIVAWGLGPVVVKLIDVTPMLGAALRFGVSIPLLAGMLIARGGRLTRAVFMRTAVPGASFGVNLIFVFASVQEVTVAVLAVVIALHPALILVLSVPVFGERPSPPQLVWTLVGVAATVGVVLGAGGALRASSVGVLLCLVSLVTFAFYFVLSRLARSTSDVDPVEWMTGINIWAFAVCLVVTIGAGDTSDITAMALADWFWLLVLAWGTGVAGHTLMSWLHGMIEAARSSLYLLGMNVVAVVVAWPVHDEPVTLVQAVCGLIVLTAVGAVLRIPSRSVAQLRSS